MRQVPRWPGLKHHNHVTTIEYTDGQGYLDILKVRANTFESEFLRLKLKPLLVHHSLFGAADAQKLPSCLLCTGLCSLLHDGRYAFYNKGTAAATSSIHQRIPDFMLSMTTPSIINFSADLTHPSSSPPSIINHLIFQSSI